MNSEEGTGPPAKPGGLRGTHASPGLSAGLAASGRPPWSPGRKLGGAGRWGRL